MNGDSFADADLCALIELQCLLQALATVLCVTHEHGDRYGRVTVDNQGRIECFVEKGTGGARPGMINAGVYAVSARLLDQVAAGSARSWEHDVLEVVPPGTLAAAIGHCIFMAQGLFAR